MKDKQKTDNFNIAKADEDQRIVFGWANVAIRKDGTQVEDLQGDVIDPEELEKAAYDHVLRFRSAGERHNPNLRGKGRLIESCVFTKEKQAAMGIPPGVLDEAWWVGYKIDDPDAWAKIKSGDYQMFSVEGKGRRETIAKSYAEAKEDVEKRSPRQRAAKRILGGGAEKPVKNICFLKADSGIIKFRKFNPYHDQIGRFSTANTFITFSPGSNPAQARRSIDRENERRRKEGVEGEVGGKFVNVGTAGGKDGYRPMEYQEAKRRAAEHARQAEEKQQPKSNFKPAKTKKEAIEYAQRELGFQKVSYGTKLDIDTINHINEQISSIQAKYPEVKGAVQELKTTRAGCLAQIRTFPNGDMNFEIGSSRYGYGLAAVEAIYKHTVNTGYHPAGTSANSIVWHEYGHVIAGQATKKQMNVSPEALNSDRNAQRDFINRRKNSSIENEWIRKAAQNMNIPERKLMEAISRYAEENAAEAFAEAFAEVTCSKSPCREAVELVKASGYYRN